MNSDLKKSDSHHLSAKLLLYNDRLEETVTLTYYRMYYMLLAMLFRLGINQEGEPIGHLGV